MEDQVSNIWALEQEGSRGAMAGEVSGGREDGRRAALSHHGLQHSFHDS